MDYKTLNVVVSDFSTHVIIIQTITQSCSNQYLAAKQITVDFYKMVFFNNNTRILHNFIFQSAIIFVETEKLDLDIHET